jgi:nucleotide-binding universal stress UspA family protein
MDSTPVTPHSVVVGVDGSPTSRLALRWAAAKAEAARQPLHVIHALETDVVLRATEQLGTYEEPSARDAVLTSAMELLADVAPDVRAVPHSVQGFGLNTLIAASRVAGTLVVGSRGRGAIPAVLLGSVSQQLLLHACCPVVVIRDSRSLTPKEGAPVVVGVDGSEASEPAVGYAFAHASETGRPLVAVHSWWWEAPEGVAANEPWSGDWSQIATQEAAVLSESLAGWRDTFSEVRVEERSIRGDPVVELLEQSHDAALLVVGTRGRGGFKGLLLGSVSRRVLKRASCPVAVVRSERQEATEADGADEADEATEER